MIYRVGLERGVEAKEIGLMFWVEWLWGNE